MLDQLVDDQRAWCTTAQIDKPELVVLVTATIDSNDDVIAARHVPGRGNRLIEEGELDDLATAGREAIHLQASCVVAPDEKLRTVCGHIRDDRRAGGQEACQELVGHFRSRPGSSDSMRATTSGASGGVFGRNLATISPPGATTNFSKFHSTSPAFPSASSTTVSSA